MRKLLLFLIFLGVCSGENPPQQFRFFKDGLWLYITPQKTILFRGEPLCFFYAGEKTFFTAEGNKSNCPQKFYGAVRIVKIVVVPQNKRKVLWPVKLRERVTVIRQSEELPDREVIDLSVKIIPSKDGITDLQVFGINLDGVPKNEAKELQQELFGAWREYRQELFLGESDSPFAIFLWRHTATRIEVIEVISSPFS
jgi:hypothetical protein